MMSPCPPVVCLFRFVSLARGDDSYEGVIHEETVANNQHPQAVTDAQHQKSVLIRCVVGIEETDCILVKKNRLRFFKRDPVLSYILPILCLIPFESYFIHMYTVQMHTGAGKSFLLWPNICILGDGGVGD
jgi:hypothetical protein